PYSTPAPAAAPAAPSPYAPPPARPAKGLATALNVLLIVFVVPVLFNFNVLMAVHGELGRLPGSSSPRRIDGFRTLQVTGFVAEGLGLLVLLAAATVWVCWFRRMRQNAESFAPGRIRYRPGLAVGSWFIPVVNFFLPKQIANDIWTATTGRPSGAGRWLMHTWWWLWVVHLATELSAYRTWDEEKTVEDAGATVVSALGGDVVAVVSTVFAVLFVSRLTRLQGERAGGAR
ncbi:LigA protein, partial [Streptomyces coelicoflavus ZG0656]